MADPSLPNFRHVICNGTAYEIGHAHGRAVANLVNGSVKFYSAFFKETARLDWTAVLSEAERWLPLLEREWPEYVEEMRGISAGANVAFLDILALNVRTEIAYGLAAPPVASDGCTALAYHPTHGPAFLAQNWDWEARQAPNIIRLTLHQLPPRASVIDMITEAGIIGKIGLSSAGVGTCLNAVRAGGINYEKLPVHLALRAALDADPRRLYHANGNSANGEEHTSSQSNANGRTNNNAKHRSSLVPSITAMLARVGVASAAHILIADAFSATGLETSSKDTAVVGAINLTQASLIVHTNHYVESHKVEDTKRLWKDTVPRLARIEKLVRQTVDDGKTIDYSAVDIWLRDEEGYPTSICRDRSGTIEVMTLFSIVMNLETMTASVKVGRPSSAAPTITLNINAN